MIKCKGCSGEIDYVPLAKVEIERKAHAGPALAHQPYLPCQWFLATSVGEIMTYIETAKHKAEQATSAQ